MKGDFEDHLWSTIGESSNFLLQFDCEIYGEINLALKCYSVQKMYNGIKAQTVRQNVAQIIRGHTDFRGFRPDYSHIWKMRLTISRCINSLPWAPVLGNF